MKMRKCDVCGKISKEELTYTLKIETNQSFGYPKADSIEEMDICNECFNKISYLLKIPNTLDRTYNFLRQTDDYKNDRKIMKKGL